MAEEGVVTLWGSVLWLKKERQHFLRERMIWEVSWEEGFNGVSMSLGSIFLPNVIHVWTSMLLPCWW